MANPEFMQIWELVDKYFAKLNRSDTIDVALVLKCHLDRIILESRNK